MTYECMDGGARSFLERNAKQTYLLYCSIAHFVPSGFHVSQHKS